MSYGDVVVTFIYAMQMMICVLFALPYKRSKKHIFLLLIVTVVEYYFVKIPTLHVETYWMAFVVEFFGTLMVLALFNSGNIWRNFLISWFNFQCANILIIIESALASYFVEVESIIIFGASGKEDDYVFVEILLMLCNSLVALAISRKLFKIKYDNDGKIYKYLVAIVVILGTVLGLKKNYMIAAVREGSTKDLYKLYVTAIAIILILMYLVSYFYNLAETKRLIKERNHLTQLIKDNYDKYAKEIDNNKELAKLKDEISEDNYIKDAFQLDVSSVTLTGNLTIDTIISKYYQEANRRNVVLELNILPLESDMHRDMKLATIIHELMRQGFKYAADSQENWIYFRIIKNMNNLLIKLEYGKAEGAKTKIKDIKLVHRIVTMDGGIINVSDKSRETHVSIMLPLYNTNNA